MLLQRAPSSPQAAAWGADDETSVLLTGVVNEPFHLLEFSTRDPRSNLCGHRAQLFIIRNKVNPALLLHTRHAAGSGPISGNIRFIGTVSHFYSFEN